MEYTDSPWASADRAKLEAALAKVDGDRRIIATTPVRAATIAGRAVFFALVRASEAIEPGVSGVSIDESGAWRTAGGVFMAGPDRRADPRDWMNRIPEAKRVAIAAAAQRDPETLLLLLRLTAGPVNPDSDETRGGVAKMRAAGMIDDDDARALLF